MTVVFCPAIIHRDASNRASGAAGPNISTVSCRLGSKQGLYREVFCRLFLTGYVEVEVWGVRFLMGAPILAVVLV
ncbi:MAG TPA: hypothetical protein ENN99_08170 [Chloroflexi bacterium]|nr:hypothetical protein [Chloroflexota bacterium]